MKALYGCVTVVLIFSMTLAPVHGLVVGANIDVTISSDTAERQQVEPTIAVDPHNPNVIIAGAQDYRLLDIGGHRWHGYYRSTDGGQTWSVMLLPGFPSDNSPAGLASPIHGFKATSDPVLAFDSSGNVYYAGITVGPAFRLFVAKFVNDGADYAFTTFLDPSIFNHGDKPWIAVDTSTTPSNGNVYMTYDSFSLEHSDSGLALIRSTDGGRTFSAPQLVIKPASLSGVTVDAQGRVFVSGLIFGRSLTTANIAVVVSSDAGLTFHGHEVGVNVTLLPSPLPGNLFRDFTIPQIAADNHGVYAVWDDFTAGNSNVMFIESTDGGVTWTTPLRINDVTSGQHFFSTIAVAGGTISVAWYDSRLGQLSNGTITGLDVFYANSKDGGLTFSSNIRVTSISFNPNIVKRADFGSMEPFMGDYIQIAATPTVAHVIWADNRDACSHVVPTFGCTDQDAFTAAITL